MAVSQDRVDLSTKVASATSVTVYILYNVMLMVTRMRMQNITGTTYMRVM